MQFKKKGNMIKIRVTQDDAPALSSALAFPILTAFAKEHPEMLIPVQSFSVELEGPIILTITSSRDPLEIVEETYGK